MEGGRDGCGVFVRGQSVLVAGKRRTAVVCLKDGKETDGCVQVVRG